MLHIGNITSSTRDIDREIIKANLLSNHLYHIKLGVDSLWYTVDVIFDCLKIHIFFGFIFVYKLSSTILVLT